MLVQRTPDSAELRDHWWWRPGWEPGSRHLQWYLTFESQTDLHRLVEQIQGALADSDGLDPVPLPWLHLTLAGFGAADALTEDCVRRLISAAYEQLVHAPRVELTFSRIAVYAESVVLVPDPSSSLTWVHSLLEESGRQILGRDAVGSNEPFAPHLSVAYAHGPASGDAVVAALQALRAVEPVRAQPTLSLVEVERDDHAYTWRLVSAFPL